MRQRPLKCYTGNYDGLREGLILAHSKREAAQIARCSVYHFEQYWRVLTETPISEIYAHAYQPLTLYTRRYNDRNWQWAEGICLL